MNILCTICSDLINQTENIFVTKCGHIFHHQCLAQWIERSKSCPQCRNKVTEKCMFRVFPTTYERPTNGENAAALQTRLDDAQLQLRQRDTTERELREELDAISKDLNKIRERATASERRAEKNEAAAAALREQLTCARALANEAVALRADNDELRTQIDLLHGLQRVLTAATDDVEQMLSAYSDLRTIATFATALKRALCESETKKNECREEVRTLRAQLAAERDRTSRLRRTLRVQSKRTDKESATNTSDDAVVADGSTAAGQSGNSILFVPTPVDANVSLNTLVNKIESANSPYLNLERGNLALTLIPHRTVGGAATAAPVTTPVAPVQQPVAVQKYTIFKGAGQPTNSELFGAMEAARSRLDTSYDGLGGHSKADEFPVPRRSRLQFSRGRLSLGNAKRRRNDR